MKFPLYLTVGFGLLFLSANKSSEKTSPVIQKIKFDHSYNCEVAEPSDIVFDPTSKSFYVVSDNGYIAEITTEGKLVRQTEEIGIDFEGITLIDKGLVTVDETPRNFQLRDKNWNLLQSKRITYLGGRNKGFESVTWNQASKTFFTATEKDPIHLFELDENFNVLNERRLPFKVRDVSALTIQNGFLWVLSDEDRTIFKCNLATLNPVKQFLLPIINPEGLTFDDKGNLIVCSDDRERLYHFSANLFQ